MKTLYSAQLEWAKKYFLCECEHCNTLSVVCQDDFDKYIVSQKSWESTWKCPLCGHINTVNKYHDLLRKSCMQNGSQNRISNYFKVLKYILFPNSKS